MVGYPFDISFLKTYGTPLKGGSPPIYHSAFLTGAPVVVFPSPDHGAMTNVGCLASLLPPRLGQGFDNYYDIV